MRAVFLACGLMVAGLGVARAQTAPPPQAPPSRSEAPIREVVLSDGVRRYTVPVKVGATSIEAGLDTGSSGLRVLPNVLQPADARTGWQSDSYSYGSGARLEGSVGKGVVAIGGLSAETTLQMVRRVDCTPDKPRCPASKIPQARYGIQGDGLPDEGFKAILGVNMAEAEVATPLRAIGARRWIVELPRPGETGPGRLVLNPTDEEVQGYAMLPVAKAYSDRRGGLHDAVSGCLANASSKKKACGPLMMDTGAPGITLTNGDLGSRPWPDQTQAILVFYDGDGHARAAETLVTGLQAHASHLMFEPRREQQGPVIFSGLTAYFAFSVLYDPAQGLVGLKPRPQGPGGPKGELTTP